MHYSILLPFVSQFVMIPYFAGFNLVAKFFFFCCVFLVILCFTKKFKIKTSFFHISIFCFLGFIFYSSFVSEFSYNSVLLSSVLLLLLFFSFFFLTDYFSNITYRVYFLSVYQLFTVVVSCFGLYAYSSFAVLGKSQGDLIPWLMPANRSLRVAGIYGQPNLFALVLLIGILVFVYSHLHRAELLTCRFPALSLIPLLTVSVTFFLTGSRAGLLALIIVLSILVWLIVHQRYLENDKYKIRQFVLLLGCIFFAFIISAALNYWLTFAGIRSLSLPGQSLDARLVFWLSAVLIFLDHPWFGVGLGNYKFYLSRYVNEAHDRLGFVQYDSMGYTKWAHNELLQLLSEGGIFVFLIVTFTLILYFFQIYQFKNGKRDWPPLKLFSYLFILPFIIHSMLSWPMRHSGLLVLFFTFLGLLLAQHNFKTVIVPDWGNKFIRITALLAFFFALSLGLQEIRLRIFADQLESGNLQSSFSEFEKLFQSSYAKYPLLLNMTPRYVETAVKNQDVVFARKILPYVKEMTLTEGAHWQWFNLSLTYHLLEDEIEADIAVKRAIDLWPVENKYWNFQHYLSMSKASRDTGRPIEDFLPVPPMGAAADLGGFFDFEEHINVKL